ncbi:MAG: FeoB-associated Cys-rich membrane protein [Candidatus Zixiibacteriota bacterium]|nr:MAG: FeoB-associated Cys-rich membrane protein [candidate division Zixibacteria bacterium]
MIWQWIIIGLLVAVAALYLYRAVKRSLQAPGCSTCTACNPRKWKRGMKKEVSGKQ